MSGLGSGERGEFTFLDIIALMSFFIGLLNLDENLTQSDKQELQDDLDRKINRLLDEIHAHLQSQDEKIDFILTKIGDE